MTGSLSLSLCIALCRFAPPSRRFGWSALLLCMLWGFYRNPKAQSSGSARRGGSAEPASATRIRVCSRPRVRAPASAWSGVGARLGRLAVAAGAEARLRATPRGGVSLGAFAPADRAPAKFWPRRNVRSAKLEFWSVFVL